MRGSVQAVPGHGPGAPSLGRPSTRVLGYTRRLGEAGVPSWRFARIGQHEGTGHVQGAYPATRPTCTRANGSAGVQGMISHGRVG